MMFEELFEEGGRTKLSKRYASSTSGLIMNTVYDACISVLFSFLPPPSSFLE